MKQPAVSVIVPCYNGGRFLDQMLASLDAQTFRNFEIIIVDDGSNEPETIQKLGNLPPEIQIVRQSNLGLAAARNTGFRQANADFVLPLDCDDALESGFLMETIALLATAPPEVAFVFTDIRTTGSFHGILPRYFSRFDQLFLNRLPYCLLLRKSAWQTVGGYDELMRDGYEDWEFNIRLVVAGFSGLGINRPLFLYYVSPHGMLMSRSARQHGKLWRAILNRHRDSYRWRSLRSRHRIWGDRKTRFGLVSAFILVWGGKLLPASLVSAVFYIALRQTHWLRRQRGILTSPGAANSHAGRGTTE